MGCNMNYISPNPNNDKPSSAETLGYFLAEDALSKKDISPQEMSVHEQFLKKEVEEEKSWLQWSRGLGTASLVSSFVAGVLTGVAITLVGAALLSNPVGLSVLGVASLVLILLILRQYCRRQAHQNTDIVKSMMINVASFAFGFALTLLKYAKVNSLRASGSMFHDKLEESPYSKLYKQFKARRIEEGATDPEQARNNLLELMNVITQCQIYMADRKEKESLSKKRDSRDSRSLTLSSNMQMIHREVTAIDEYLPGCLALTVENRKQFEELCTVLEKDFNVEDPKISKTVERMKKMISFWNGQAGDAV